MKLEQRINAFFCGILFGKKRIAKIISEQQGEKSESLSSFLKGGINELKTEVAKHKTTPQTPHPSS